MNLVAGVVEPGGVRVGSAVIPVVDAVPAVPGAAVTVGIRPESLSPASAGEGIPATVSIVEELGAEAFVYAQLQNVEGNIIARVHPSSAPGNGDLVHLRVTEGSMLFFDAETGDRLRRRGE
jgi:multiple sugar transport system ATP-binding protein